MLIYTWHPLNSVCSVEDRALMQTKHLKYIINQYGKQYGNQSINQSAKQPI